MRWVSQYSNANMVKTDFFEAKSTAYAKKHGRTAICDSCCSPASRFFVYLPYLLGAIPNCLEAGREVRQCAELCHVGYF